MSETTSDVIGRLTADPESVTPADVKVLLQALEDTENEVQAASTLLRESNDRLDGEKRRFQKYLRDSAKPIGPEGGANVYFSITDWQGQYAKIMKVPEHQLHDIMNGYLKIDGAALFLEMTRGLLAEVITGWLHARSGR